MTTVPPPINPTLPQVLAAAVNAPVATIAAPPPVLATLPTGTPLQGTVTPTPDPRVMLLSTAAGEVTLRVPTPLPEGATVSLEVVRATPAQLTVKLVAIDGAPIQLLTQAPRQPLPLTPDVAPQLSTPAPLPTVPGAAAPLQPGTAWWPGGAQPITQLPVLSGFVIAAPTPQTQQTPNAPTTPSPTPTTPVATAPTAPVLVQGADVALKIVSVTLPTTPAATPTPQTAAPPAAVAPQTPAPQPPQLGTSTPTAAVPTPGPTAPAPVALTPLAPTPSATMADLTPTAPRVADPQTTPGLVLPKTWPAPDAAPPATVQPQPPLARVTGVVVALNEGVPVIRVGEAEVQINARANLPVGSTVTIEVRAVLPPLTPLPIAPQPPTAHVPLSLAQPSWPTLTESLQLLQRVDPVAAQQLANAIPDGGARTAVAAMSFVQAMRTGEMRQWPGDVTLRALERAGPRGAHLASQLSAEVDSLSRNVRDAGTEWRAMPLPFHDEGRIERVRMVFREVDADADAEKKRGGTGTRFLVDLDLSRLGAMQLDGMFRKTSRQLDLTIRTKATLPDDMRLALTGIFTQSNAAMGLAGALTFQVTPRFPDPTAAKPTGDKSGLWV